MPGSPRSAWARRAAGLLLALVLAGLVAELGLRTLGVHAFRAWSPRGMHRADPETGLEPTPGFVGRQETEEFSVEIRIDADGLRAADQGAHPVDAQVPVVLLLGDSFAFGHGVENDETIASRLGRRLGPHLDVRNAGVMSFGTVQEAARFEHLAPLLAPRLCVLLFFAGNDVLDNLRAPLTVRDGHVLNRGDELTLARRLKLALKYRSALYRVLAERFFPARIEGLCSDHASFGLDAFRRAPPPAVERAWQATEEALSVLARSARARDCRLVVACLPTRFQVEPERWRALAERCGLGPGDVDLGAVQQRLARVCEGLGLPYLDLLPGFREAREPLYYRGLLEMHLDPAGHALAADLLAGFLLANDLVP